MKARAKDWQTKLVGRDVAIDMGSDYRVGSLCGYETDGDGNIVRFRVAFAPADWADFPAEDVELAG